MNKYKEVLLIGGLADGRIVNIVRDCKSLKMPKLTRPLVKFHDKSTLPQKDFESERYESELISGEYETFEVFKSATINVDEMIKKLIEGYKP